MKNNILLRICSIIVLFLFFSACSKEIPLQTENQNHNSTSPVTGLLPGTTGNTGNSGVQLYGAITGTISPAGIKTYLVAFNAAFVSPEFYPDEQTGRFTIENLPEGGYNLRIMYVFPSSATYSTLTIWRIKVTGKNITDLGTLNLK